MKEYHHLSQEQRYQIQALIRAGKSQTFIAEQLGCHKSTISRELKRNTRLAGVGTGIYDADFAIWTINRRNKERYPNLRFTDEMRNRIVSWLTQEQFSPELISAYGKQIFGDFVSHETIYKWIWSVKQSQRRIDQPYSKLYKHLKHGGRRQKRGNRKENRGCIPERISIEQRPSLVNNRDRIGDLEVDLMWGRNLKSALLVITDRASLFTKLKKIKTKKASVIARTIIKILEPHKSWVKTLTYDNDLAFAKHQLVNEALNTQSYFTHPYSPQEKGTVENRIWVLRRFFPKKVDLQNINWSQVKKVENYLNKRPVRKFKYNSPNDVFLQKSKVALAT